jgi:hypothetical protein
MTRRLETSVLIVGGGPVGLTLAIDLASRGVDVIVAEMRLRREPPSVKCNHVSARSMEIFRRLGVADALRHAGLPADYPNDCSFRTTFTGPELARIPIPCRRDRFTATGGPDTWWPTPEPPHRINQVFLEPILFDHAEAQARVTPGPPRRGQLLLAVAAHSGPALARAARLGADAALLSPVFATASHLGAKPLGAVRFRALVRGSRVPVVALGGISADNVARLGRQIAGVAAIGALEAEFSRSGR